jgi:hypothetical protein
LVKSLSAGIALVLSSIARRMRSRRVAMACLAWPEE